MAARRHLTLEEISAWFDGEVELGEIEHRHLRDCAECGAVRDGHSRLRRLARKAIPRVPADDIWRTVTAGLDLAPDPALEPAAVSGPAPEPPAPARRRAEPESPAADRAPFPRGGRLPPRAAALLLTVAGIVAVLLVLPGTPRRALRPVPAPPAPGGAIAVPADAGTAHPVAPKPASAPAGPARPADEAAAAARALRTVQARMGRIEFDLGRTDPNAASEPALREVAAILARYPGARAVVEGHTDDTGGTEWNLKMSRARAEAVVRWLVEKGSVRPRRLEAKGFGGLRPVADNSTEAGQDANRRVEFAVVGVPPARTGRPSAAPARTRQTYNGGRFILTADEFTTASPDLISASGDVRVEPVNPAEPYVAVVDGYTRTLTGAATGIVGEIINPGEHLILHTRRPGTPAP